MHSILHVLVHLILHFQHPQHQGLLILSVYGVGFRVYIPCISLYKHTPPHDPIWCPISQCGSVGLGSYRRCLHRVTTVNATREMYTSHLGLRIFECLGPDPKPSGYRPDFDTEIRRFGFGLLRSSNVGMGTYALKPLTLRSLNLIRV